MITIISYNIIFSGFRMNMIDVNSEILRFNSSMISKYDRRSSVYNVTYYITAQPLLDFDAGGACDCGTAESAGLTGVAIDLVLDELDNR